MIRRHFRTLLGVYTQRQRIAFAAKILLWSGTAVLPEVITADMNSEIQGGNASGFSDVLLQNIE